MRAARWWRLNPRQWRAETADDRAEMLAVYLFDCTLEARRAEHVKKIMDKENQKDEGGANDFRRLKDRLKT